MGGFLLLATALVLSDQSRLQPWLYQYFFMIAAFWVGSRDTSGVGGQKAVLNTCRLVLITMYFWSGVQKINVSFLDRVFPALIEPYLNIGFGTGEEFSPFLILFVPLVEVGIAIGFLIRRFRDVAVCMSVMTHLFILMLFVPVWRNSVVWPWNVAMAGFSVILFWRCSEFSVRDILVPRPLSMHMCILILFGMMPLFSFLGSWDSYLSFSLYSGNVAFAGIHVSERTIERLPPDIRVQVERPGRYDGRPEIDLNKWSLRELNVPTYPERRVFRSVTKRLCNYAEHPSDVILTVHERPDWLTGFREVYIYNCSSLGSRSSLGTASSRDSALAPTSSRAPAGNHQRGAHATQ